MAKRNASGYWWFGDMEEPQNQVTFTEQAFNIWAPNLMHLRCKTCGWTGSVGPAIEDIIGDPRVWEAEDHACEAHLVNRKPAHMTDPARDTGECVITCEMVEKWSNKGGQ